MLMVNIYLSGDNSFSQVNLWSIAFNVLVKGLFLITSHPFLFMNFVGLLVWLLAAYSVLGHYLLICPFPHLLHFSRFLQYSILAFPSRWGSQFCFSKFPERIRSMTININPSYLIIAVILSLLMLKILYLQWQIASSMRFYVLCSS